MPWRRRLIASSRSSCSARIASSRVSSSFASSSARRLTPPSRSRSAFSLCSRVSVASASGRVASGASSASARSSSSGPAEMLRRLRRQLRLAAAGGDHPLLVAAANLPRLGKRVERRAGGVCAPRRARPRRRRARPKRPAPPPPPRRFRRISACRRPSKIVRIVRHRGDRRVERLQPLLEFGDALLGALDAGEAQRSRSAAISASAAHAQRLLMRRALRLEPRFRRGAAIARKARLHRVAPALRASAMSGRPSSASDGGAKLGAAGVVVRVDTRQRPGIGGEPLGDAGLPPLRLGQGGAATGPASRAPASTPARAGCRRVRRSARRRGLRREGRRSCRAPSRRASRNFSSAERRRDGSAVPAAAPRRRPSPASTRNPSQRHSPPSRVTSRWPSTRRRAILSASAAATMPIWRSRRSRRSGARTKAASGSAPSGSAGSLSPDWLGPQKAGASESSDASRSSPSAAASAFS